MILEVDTFNQSEEWRQSPCGNQKQVLPDLRINSCLSPCSGVFMFLMIVSHLLSKREENGTGVILWFNSEWGWKTFWFCLSHQSDFFFFFFSFSFLFYRNHTAGSMTYHLQFSLRRARVHRACLSLTRFAMFNLVYAHLLCRVCAILFRFLH